MKAQPALPWEFLKDEPQREQVLQALVENTQLWVERCVQSAGGEINRAEGVTWVYTPGPAGDAALLFPRLSEASAAAQIDEIVAYFRTRQPERDILCWSLDPPQPRDLEAYLLARGFEWNWRPHWMWCPLQTLSTEATHPPELHIEIVEGVPLWDVADLPYYSLATAEQLARTTQQEPRQVWHFAARLHGEVVGQSRLNLTLGELGVAGIFDVGVVPKARGLGIGKAVTLAACRLAQSLGCRHALLNASALGEPVYRRLGFQSLGYGKTWLLRRALLVLPPPSPQQVELTEAVGRGDLARLARLAPQLDAALYAAPLPSGITPLQVGVRLQREAAVRWLMERGVELDLLAAWDLGWKEEAQQLLRRRPELANMRQGASQVTPLHVAVERDDQELAALLLSATPDLTLRDQDFKATALEWAHYLKRQNIALLLEHYQNREP